MSKIHCMPNTAHHDRHREKMSYFAQYQNRAIRPNPKANYVSTLALLSMNYFYSFMSHLIASASHCCLRRLVDRMMTVTGHVQFPRHPSFIYHRQGQGIPNYPCSAMPALPKPRNPTSSVHSRDESDVQSKALPLHAKNVKPGQRHRYQSSLWEYADNAF
jgi:hypothetical protein